MIVCVGHETWVLTHQLNSGGEATIWLHPHDANLVVKVYDPGKRPLPKRLEHLVNCPPVPLMERGFTCYTWPKTIATDARTGEVVGFTMRRVERMMPLGGIWNPANRIPQISRRWLLQVAHSFCMRVYVLHQHGYLRVDINAANDLVDRHGRVTSIDVDSVEFRVGDTVFPTPRTRPEFQPPELLTGPSPLAGRSSHTDAWSVAIVVHMLVRNGQHPFHAFYTGSGKPRSQLDMIRDGRWIDEPGHRDFVTPRGVLPYCELPLALAELFRRTFQAGHGDAAARPSVVDYLQCLDVLMRTWR